MDLSFCIITLLGLFFWT